MKHSSFVHLHVHTEYSILDSTLRIKELVSKAESYKMSSLAITDNSVLFGAVAFYEACKSHGIKPILGVEAYVAPKSLKDKTPKGIPNESYSMLLLVKDDEGYRNLSNLITVAQFDGFYYRPRIDKELLSKHAKGLIAIDGGLGGEIASLLLQNNTNEALSLINFYQSIFGKDNFYLELADHGLKQEKFLNEKIIEISKTSGAGLVATNDCHYLERDDSFAREIAKCISSGVTINESRNGMVGSEYYFKSAEEMTELFKEVPEAITNTLKIAERCNFDFDLKTLHMPEFEPPIKMPREEYLLKLCHEGMKGKVDGDAPEIKKRLEHEFSIIRQMGFISYFLIVSDFVNYAKKNDIPVGPGRGSAAGSLIAFLLGITNVNPLENGLLFERFLNPSRVSMPDIDIDFCYDRRTEVIEYVSNVYGKRSVAQIITFGTLAARAVIRDVGRVMGIPLPKVDQIAKLIPAEPKMTLKKALELEPKINEIIKEDKEIEGLFDNAIKLEGLPRNTSTHAAGIIISKGDLTEKVPLYKGQNDEVITQFDGPACEKVGLLKMDFLGLKTLTLLENALKKVKLKIKDYPIKNLLEIPMNDSKTYDLLNKANTLGVFQLESSGMRDLMKRLGVKDFADIVALVALYRPGPMQMADEFIKRKHGQVKVEYLHPSMEGILKETHGIMLYQEQVMQCAQVLAGFTLAEADNLRKIMGKKKADAMIQLRDKFVDGAVKNKVDKTIAEKVFEQMEYFAGYGFNKSHSVAYGLIAYQTAWMKANHPEEFMAAILSLEKSNIDKISFYVEECKAMGIEIKPPSILYSFDDFCVEEKSIRFGMGAIKNVGSHAVESIINARIKHGLFKNLEDLAKQIDSRTLNRKTLESLIKAGVFDELEPNRRYLFEIIDDIIKFNMGSKKDGETGQESFLDLLDSSSKQSISPKKRNDYPNWPEHDLLKAEKELLGCYISGHPLAEYSKILKRFSTVDSSAVKNLKDSEELKIGGVISNIKLTRTQKTSEEMAIIQLEDLHGTIEAVVYPRIFKLYRELITIDAPVYILGIVQFRNETASVIINEVIKLDRVQETLTTAIYIRIHESAENSAKLNRLKEITEKYPGSCNVVLDLLLAGGKTLVIKSSGNNSVSPCEEAISEIEHLFGEECVWLHIKNRTTQTFTRKNKNF